MKIDDHDPDQVPAPLFTLRPMTPEASATIVVEFAAPARLDLDHDTVRLADPTFTLAQAQEWGPNLTKTVRGTECLWQPVAANAVGFTHLIHVPIALGVAADFLARVTDLPSDAQEAAAQDFAVGAIDLDAVILDHAFRDPDEPAQ